MYKNAKIFLLGLLLLQTTSIFSVPFYNYLCGADEDGCYSNEPDTCLCIAGNPDETSICFTYESCVPPDPLTQQCAYNQINEKTEARCLATLWQSEPTPACRPLTKLPTPDICGRKCTNLYDCEPTR